MNSTGSLVHMLLGLALVLGAIVAAAWLVKRLGPRHPAAGRALRIVAGAAVGQRERVVLVEVGSTWLVVGVTPNSISALHHLPRVELEPELPAADAARPAFADWLQKLMEKRRGQ